MESDSDNNLSNFYDDINEEEEQEENDSSKYSKIISSIEKKNESLNNSFIDFFESLGIKKTFKGIETINNLFDNLEKFIESVFFDNSWYISLVIGRRSLHALAEDAADNIEDNFFSNFSFSFSFSILDIEIYILAVNLINLIIFI